MIEIKNLTEKDIGRDVVYKTPYDEEIGKIKGWNNTYIFVVFKCDNKWEHYKDYTASAVTGIYLCFI